MVKTSARQSKPAAGGRVRKLNKKQSKRHARSVAAAMPTSFVLTKNSWTLIRSHWRTMTGIVVVYALLNLLFTGGIIYDLGNSINTYKNSHSLSNALSGFGSLLGSSAGGSQTSASMQSVLIVLESLVIIWAARQLLAKDKITVKQAYYSAMTPLIPFLLVCFAIIIQLLPMTLGGAFLSAVLSSSIANTPGLIMFFSIIFILLAGWTIYMVSSSVFALYIVALPGMQPRQALRSAKDLVKYRRWIILRRLFFLPLIILACMAVITIPFIIWIPFLVVPVFFILMMFVVLFANVYLYNLYRGLIV